MARHILTVVNATFKLHRARLYVSNISSKSLLAKVLKILERCLQRIKREGHVYFVVVNTRNFYALHLRKVSTCRNYL
jgi:hypothetical protein